MLALNCGPTRPSPYCWICQDFRSLALHFTRILFNPQSYDTFPPAYFKVCSDHTWPARTKTMPPSDIFWGIRDISGHSQVVVFQIENISWRGAKRFLCWYAEDKLGLQILKMNTRLSFSSPCLQVKLCMLMQGILDGCTLARIHWHPMSGLGWSEVGSVGRVAPLLLVVNIIKFNISTCSCCIC